MRITSPAAGLAPAGAAAAVGAAATTIAGELARTMTPCPGAAPGSAEEI